jgi:hypothetical protein
MDPKAKDSPSIVGAMLASTSRVIVKLVLTITDTKATNS